MKNYILSMVFGALIMALPAAYAMGVSTPYWDTKPLNMVPGQSIEVELLLQNMVGGDDVTLVGKISKGEDIAVMTDPDKQYKVPFGEKNVPVHVRVTLPSTARVGYAPRIVGVSFREIAVQQGSMVQIGGGIGSSFPVVVEAPQVSPTGAASGGAAGGGANPIFTTIVAAVAVTLLLFMVARKRKAR